MVTFEWFSSTSKIGFEIMASKEIFVLNIMKLHHITYIGYVRRKDNFAKLLFSLETISVIHFISG
jgi:hypothetical protein